MLKQKTKKPKITIDVKFSDGGARINQKADGHIINRSWISSPLISKIKKTLIQSYQQSMMRSVDPKKLGKAMNWRINVIGHLLTYRNKEIKVEVLNKISGICLIHRQAEAELDLYQQALQDLASELENEEITQPEFENRLENITIAILVISFLAGSETEPEHQDLFDAALNIINEGGANAADLDISGLPQEAQDQLNSEIAIALSAGNGLAETIANGQFEDRQEALFSRLALWTTTALGIVSLGKMFLEDDRFLIWLYNPLKQNCNDCFGLNGQIHTVNEWRAFFMETGKSPQSKDLICQGFNCGCGLFNADGPSVGNFV